MQVIQKNIQKTDSSIIFHIRLIITREITPLIYYTNLCIEYTFLKEGGEGNQNQETITYYVRDFASYVTKNKTT